LSPEDLEEIQRIARIYLSDLEIRENRKLFEDACQSEIISTFGFGGVHDDELVGFLIGTIMPADGSLDKQFNRPTPVSTGVKSAIFQHLYVVPNHWGEGIGTNLLRTALECVESQDVSEVYAEAWIDPETPDAVPLLENHGFVKIYDSDDYWAHDGFAASSVPCPSHGMSYAECPCEGAVYVKRDV
jgi:GNAT superfamily N-acetyltransferase